MIVFEMCKLVLGVKCTCVHFIASENFVIFTKTFIVYEIFLICVTGKVCKCSELATHYICFRKYCRFHENVDRLRNVKLL
uniref:Uncharacterized protein n=1 Tax=Pararge aegeria TaxID=116150 RepID=S4PIL6_9NEOP